MEKMKSLTIGGVTYAVCAPLTEEEKQEITYRVLDGISYEDILQPHKREIAAQAALDVKTELDMGQKTLTWEDFTIGRIDTNKGMALDQTVQNFASTPAFLPCTAAEPYSVVSNGDSSFTVFYYGSGAYLGMVTGLRTNIADICNFGGFNALIKDKNWGAADVTHIRLMLNYHNNKTVVTGENLAQAVSQFTFTRRFADPYVRGSAVEFDPESYGLPALKLTGVTAGISKDDKVNLTYVYGDRSGTCTLKWQGSSSTKYEKKNYTIEFGNAFEAAPGWGEQRKYCLKANYIDFSHARNLVSAKLWGQMVASRANVDEKLASAPNYGAVDGFPIVLYINGKYQGIYTFNIPKDGWLFNMGSGTQEAAVCANGPTSTAVVNLRDPNVVLGTDYDVEYAPNEDDVGWIKTSLDNMIKALNPSTTLTDISTVDPYLDWDSVIDYLIFTSLVNGYDCIVKNYILVTYNGKKWAFSAYDLDSTYGLQVDGKQFLPMQADGNTNVTVTMLCAANRAMELVKKFKLPQLKARYAELRSGILSEDNVITTFANFIGSIPKALYDRESLLWKGLPSTASNNLQQIADYYKRKCAAMDVQIESLKEA